MVLHTSRVSRSILSPVVWSGPRRFYGELASGDELTQFERLAVELVVAAPSVVRLRSSISSWSAGSPYGVPSPVKAGASAIGLGKDCGRNLAQVAGRTVALIGLSPQPYRYVVGH